MASVYPGPQVVVIDDDVSSLNIVCELLADANITAEGCRTGTYAFKYILHRRPSVVLLDVLMPGLDGVEVFHQLRADPFMEHTTVVFFTANMAYLRKRFPDYEAHGAIVIPKPLDSSALIALVSKALRIEPGQPLQGQSVCQ